MWGEAPMAPEEIFETFAAYIEGKIPKLVRCFKAVSSRHNEEKHRSFFWLALLASGPGLVLHLPLMKRLSEGRLSDGWLERYSAENPKY